MSSINLRRFLHAIWYTPGHRGRWGLGFRFVGLTGEAKTSIIEEVARSSSLHLEVIAAGLHTPEDFAGMPVIREDRTEFRPMAKLLRATRATRAVVFFDEMNQATPATQGALLKGIHEGTFGDLELPPGVRMIGAHNPVDVAAGGWDLADPIRTRWGFMQWPEVELDAFCAHLLGGGIDSTEAPAVDAAREEERVLAAWPEPWARSRGLVAGFLRAKPTMLRQHPKADGPKPETWATLRTWESAARFLAGAELHALDAITTEAGLAGFLGPGVAGEFSEWMVRMDLPDPAEVLDGVARFSHDAKRPDRTAAVLGSLSALLVSAGCASRRERARRFFAIVEEVAGKAADLATLGINTIMRDENRRFFPEFLGSKEYISAMAKLEPVTRAARIGQGGGR